MSLKSALIAAAAGALLVSGAGFAQVPPDPNNPNEAVPEKHTYMPYGETITLVQAKKVADAALADATKRDWQMCIAVVGPTGDPIVVNGKIIGAIGVSGGTGSQDDVISQAGAAAMK